MAEIAGLALGGIPLAIWALEKYAEPFEEFRHYRISIETFRADLKVQNWQLQTTLNNAGLGNETTADEIHDFFQIRFPTIAGELTTIVQRMSGATADLLENLGIDSHIKPDALPDRAHWEWKRVKHSFSTKKRTKIIDDLRNWNADLSRCLERSEVPADDESRHVCNLTRHFNKDRCSSLRQSLFSLHRALHSSCRCACSSQHQAAIDLDWSTYESNTAQPFKVAVSYGTNHQRPHEAAGAWRKLNITPKPIRTEVALTAASSLPDPSPTQSGPPISSLRVRFVRRLSRSRTPPPPSPSSARDISQSPPSTPTPPPQPEIESLCAAVTNSRVPWMVNGLLKDPDTENGLRHFSLEHRQKDAAQIVRLVPVKSLLSMRSLGSRQHNSYLYLSAQQRYGIAASAAWSLLHLSGSPWLSKQWDQEQAGIFLEDHAGLQALSQHPCLSTNLGPPNAPDQLQESQGHPESDMSHLIPNKNVSVLGIFLVELCLNMPFAEIRGAADSATPAALLLKGYDAALRSLVEVRGEAGESYGNAVERCIKFSFYGRDVTKNFDFESFRWDFYRTVVAPIQATYHIFRDMSNGL